MYRFTLIFVTFIALAAVATAAPAWPHCAVRSGVAGGPAIEIEKQPFSPLLFAVNNQFGRDDVLVKEIRNAVKADIRLFVFGLKLDWHTSPKDTAETIARFAKEFPEGYFLLRISLAPNKAWLDAHPGDAITLEDGTRLPYASPSSAAWREEAAARLESRLREVLEGPFAHQFTGVVLESLQTAEWFYPETNAYADYSPAALSAFRAWLRNQYTRPKNLQEAWHRPDITFDSAMIPTSAEREATGWGPFRDPAAQRPAMDYARFLSENTVEAISHFAKRVKSVTQNRSLTGVFYGYTFELNGNGPRAMAHSGHLALDKLLALDNLDIVCAPYSYFERGVGEPGHFHAPIDEIALHGKLAILEEDMYTHIAKPPSENLIAPGWNERATSPEETLTLLRRDFGRALAHRAGIWLFDLLSDGRWNAPECWSFIPMMRRMAAEVRGEPPFAPEVAFVADEASVFTLADTTHPILYQSLYAWRAELDRTGATVGYYLQSSLAKLPASIKVIILANPYRISPEELRELRRRAARGATIIFTYAPGIAGPEGIDTARIQEITGFPIEAKADNTPIAITSAITQESATIEQSSWRPRFVIQAGKDIDIVARYRNTDEICAAARPEGQGVFLYTAVPRLPVITLREIFKRAGVNLYADNPMCTAIAGPYYFVHTHKGIPGETLEDLIDNMNRGRAYTFHWPAPCYSVNRIVPQRPWPLTLETENTWRDILPGGNTAIYRVGPAPK